MFWRRRSRDDLYEDRIVDLKEAHAAEIMQMMRLVEMLAEQVDYLRAQMGRPHLAKVQPVNPSQQPLVSEGDPSYMSEEEEDILALHEGGHLSELEMEQALAKAGVRNTQITAESL